MLKNASQGSRVLGSHLETRTSLAAPFQRPVSVEHRVIA
jgi:hypothetical protein